MSQANYAITHGANHTPNQMSHEAINRYLREDRLASRSVWMPVRSQIQISPSAFAAPDALDPGRNFSCKNEAFRCKLTHPAGIEKNQDRTARIRRHRIACAMPAWMRVTAPARKTGQTTYRMKLGLLDDCLCRQIKNPSVKMRFS